MDHVEAQTTRILGSVSAGSMKSSAARFYTGDVLYGRLRPYLNKVAQPAFDGLASAEFIVFPDTEITTSKFLKFRLNAADFVSFASHLNEGDRPRVNFEQIGEFEILVPPINEQHRIVAKIEALFSELDKGIENFKTAREQLKIYRQSLLKHAFSGKLTEQWRAEYADKLESAETLLQRIQTERQQRYQQQLKDWEAGGKQGSKPKAPKTLPPLTTEELAELPELPMEWRWEKNENFLFEVKDGTHDTPKYVQDGIPFVTQKNIRNGKLVLDDVSFISEADHLAFSKRSNVQRGDVIISMIGHGRGQCCIVDTDLIFSIKNVGLFKFFHKLQSNKYLCYYYQSKMGGDLVLATSKGGAQPFIGLTELRNWAIPITSFTEQCKIVEELDSKLSEIDQLDQTIFTALQQAEALRQSILKKAFSGQLVPQDPSDEPASVLLERIRAEQAVSDKPKTRKTKHA
ncbi:hypothetical protein A1356_11580 [Methylomonas koyamae]|uniref:Type I restriction modification DNA specificity domain-containing protein n=2 Tax=Methylomonas koyamae TaxID=702114 RepID=A0AA91DD10_9GAMM|nr:hypothetical protein A1356_11580 [Methylomonas koyamae]